MTNRSVDDANVRPKGDTERMSARLAALGLQAERRYDVLLGGNDTFPADRVCVQRIRQGLSSTGNPT